MTFRRPSTPSSTQTEEEKKMSLLSRIGLWVDLSGFWLTRATWRYVSLHHILIFSPFVTTSRILMSSDYVLVWLLLVNFFLVCFFLFYCVCRFLRSERRKFLWFFFTLPTQSNLICFLSSIFSWLSISSSYPIALLISGHNQLFETSLLFHFKCFAICV